MRKRNKYQVSADKMYRLKVKLTNRIKSLPESEVKLRETLTRKIELLSVIRQDMEKFNKY